MTAAPPAASRLLVWLRAAILGAVVVAVGSVSHAQADGLLPSPTAMVLVLAASTGLAALFLTRPASRLRVIGLVVGGQAVVHLMLTMLAGHRGDPAGAGTVPRTLPTPARHGSLHSQYDATVGAVVAERGRATDPLVHLVDHLVSQPPAMVLAHLLAAVVVGAWLAVGESALWAVLLLGATVLAALLGRAPAAVLVATTPRLRRPRRRRTRLRLAGLLTTSAPRRGPPLLLAR